MALALRRAHVSALAAIGLVAIATIATIATARADETPAAAAAAVAPSQTTPSQATGSAAAAPAFAPLHDRIDAMVESAAVGPLAGLCSDADFVRRVYLDLAGVIPTAAQVEAFLADRTPDKRRVLIEQLLASDDFLRHMTQTLDVWVMERKAEKAVKQAEWEEYLLRSLAEDKPLDQMLQAMLASDGSQPAERPAARFVLDRDAEPNLLTRDVGRLLFGMDLQCCQCHDHPLIDDYRQEDYYGLYAFVMRTSLFTDPKSKQVLLAEKAEGEASFKSVFDGSGRERVVPRLPKGVALWEEPAFPAGEEYIQKPDKTTRGVPKYSRRAELARRLPASGAFARNLANRLWALVMGRGLVHPVDYHSAGNPPTHPALLTLLAEELTRGGYALKPFIRELLLTRTYQRACDAPRPETINFADVAARLAELTRQAAEREPSLGPLNERLAAAKAAFTAAQKQRGELAAQLPKLQAALAEARQKRDAAQAARQAAETAVHVARQKASLLAQSAATLSAAAGQLPDDRTVAELAEKLAAHASLVSAQVQEAEKKLHAAQQAEAEAGRQHEQADAALRQATSALPSPAKLAELEAAWLAQEQAVADARFELAALRGRIELARAILEYRELAATDADKAAARYTALVDRWTVQGQVAPLRPLTPEQLAASLMQATGVWAGELSAAAAKAEKSSALTSAPEGDRPGLRRRLVQQELLARLRGTLSEFVRQYGGEAGQDFQATVNQALFFGNGGTIDGWLKPSGENLMARLSKMDHDAQLAQAMYHAVLSRPASADEAQQVAVYLRGRQDKPQAIAEMAWALLASTEFLFNH